MRYPSSIYLLVRLDLVVALDSLGVRRRSALAVVAAAGAGGLGRVCRRGADVGGGGGRPVVHWLGVFWLLLRVVLGLRIGLGMGMGCWHDDVGYALAADVAVLVVVGYPLVVVRLGEFGDDVPGVEKPGDLGGC